MEKADSTDFRSGNSPLHSLAGLLASVAIFLGIGYTRLGIEFPDTGPDSLLEEFYLPPPPPPPAKPPEPQEKPIEIDFSVPIDPSPFELSLDFLKVKVGVKSEAFTQVAFDINQSIDDYRSDGLESLQIYDRGEVDDPPKVIRRFAPKLPSHLDGVTLSCFVQYRVTPDGNTENVAVLDTNLPETNAAIVESVRRWRFKPAIKDGEPVHSWVRHAITIRTSPKPDSPFSIH